jgi:hypothetical protein
MPPVKKSETIFVTIFHELTEPRSFEIKLGFIRRLCLTAAAITLGFLLSTSWLMKNVWTSSRRNPAFEQNQSLAPVNLEPPLQPHLSSPEALPTLHPEPVALQTAKLTEPTHLQPITQSAQVWYVSLVNFETMAQPEKGIFHVHFAIEVDKEKPNQHYSGRIVVLVHGQGSIFSYPPEALNPSALSLFQISQGEAFSVSRFREVRADFEIPADIQPHLSHVEAFLFDKNSEWVTHKIWKL